MQSVTQDLTHMASEVDTLYSLIHCYYPGGSAGSVAHFVGAGPTAGGEREDAAGDRGARRSAAQASGA
eukprot:316074-Pyramimonas_sp.AAC.1